MVYFMFYYLLEGEGFPEFLQPLISKLLDKGLLTSAPFQISINYYETPSKVMKVTIIILIMIMIIIIIMIIILDNTKHEDRIPL